MSDIVERLRDIDPTPPLSFHADLRREAAAEIERLRAALRAILATDTNGYTPPETMQDIAREALGE